VREVRRYVRQVIWEEVQDVLFQGWSKILVHVVPLLQIEKIVEELRVWE
jgi:hypothetical protein